MSLFADVVAEKLDAERNLIQSLMKALESAFADRLARTIVIDEGLPDEVKVGVEVLVDCKVSLHPNWALHTGACSSSVPTVTLHFTDPDGRTGRLSRGSKAPSSYSISKP